MILKMDNRTLTADQAFSWLTTNHTSGVTSVTVENGTFISPSGDDFILIGDVGSEKSEIRRAVMKVTDHDFTCSATDFAHPEGTRATRIPYDQVRFYWTATEAFDTLNPVSGYLDLQVDEWYTRYDDATHATGFGWFVLYNSQTTAMAASASAIPYAGYGRDTVKAVLDGFWSALGQNDRKRVTLDEAMEWLNEANDLAWVELGAQDPGHVLSDGTDTLAVTAGIAAYVLPDDFGGLISVTSEGELLEPVEPNEAWMANSDHVTDPPSGFVLRGRTLELVPAPTEDATLTYRYMRLASGLNSYHQQIALPNKGFNHLKWHMLFMAGVKLQRQDLLSYRALFEQAVARMVARSAVADGLPDSFGISEQARV
jgi:hypothetical protein